MPRSTLTKEDRFEARNRLYGNKAPKKEEVIVVGLKKRNQDAELTKIQMKSAHRRRMLDSHREVPKNKINYIEMSPEADELVQALKMEEDEE